MLFISVFIVLTRSQLILKCLNFPPVASVLFETQSFEWKSRCLNLPACWQYFAKEMRLKNDKKISTITHWSAGKEMCEKKEKIKKGKIKNS